MAGELEALNAAVSRNSTVIDEAVAKLKLGGIDPAAVAAASASLEAKTDELAAAVSPPAPEPTP